MKQTRRYFDAEPAPQPAEIEAEKPGQSEQNQKPVNPIKNR